jgi:hypothetical protein
MRKRENEEDREKGNEEKEMKGKRRGTMSRTQDGQINGGKAVWGFVWRGIGEPQQQQQTGSLGGAGVSKFPEQH